VRAAVSIVILLLLTATVSAQEGKEVLLLDEGAYGTTVKGGLAPGETRTYYLSAKKGQQFRASLISLEDNGYLIVTDSQGRPLLEDLPASARVRNLDVILPHSGKYKLEIAAKGQCSYLLEVTLDDPPGPAPAPKDDKDP
jgi:hypothetical protein